MRFTIEELAIRLSFTGFFAADTLGKIISVSPAFILLWWKIDSFHSCVKEITRRDCDDDVRQPKPQRRVQKLKVKIGYPRAATEPVLGKCFPACMWLF